MKLLHPLDPCPRTFKRRKWKEPPLFFHDLPQPIQSLIITLLPVEIEPLHHDERRWNKGSIYITAFLDLIGEDYWFYVGQKSNWLRDPNYRGSGTSYGFNCACRDHPPSRTVMILVERVPRWRMDEREVHWQREMGVREHSGLPPHPGAFNRSVHGQNTRYEESQDSERQKARAAALNARKNSDGKSIAAVKGAAATNARKNEDGKSIVGVRAAAANNALGLNRNAASSDRARQDRRAWRNAFKNRASFWAATGLPPVEREGFATTPKSGLIRVVAHNPAKHPLDTQAVWARSIDGLTVEQARGIPGPNPGRQFDPGALLRKLCADGIITVFDDTGKPIHGPGSEEHRKPRRRRT